jgi:hypothetical protein
LTITEAFIKGLILARKSQEENMESNEWREKVESEISGLKKRLAKLEGNQNSSTSRTNKKTIDLEIEWPELYIDSLHFTKQTTLGVFELKDDGNYYSRDILFNSARDTDKGTERDLLSEYLDSKIVKDAFITALNNAGIEADMVSVFLPEKNQGVKKYNGVDWWYWLLPRYSGSSSYFCSVYPNGYSGNYYASSVGGCAPAFCVVRHG